MKENQERSNIFIGEKGEFIEKSDESFVGKEGMLKKEKRDLINEMKNNGTFNYLSKMFQKQFKGKEDLKITIKRIYNVPGLLFNLSEPRDRLRKEDEKTYGEKFEKEIENVCDYFCEIAENEEEFEKYWNYIQSLE